MMLPLQVYWDFFGFVGIFYMLLGIFVFIRDTTIVKSYHYSKVISSLNLFC